MVLFFTPPPVNVTHAKLLSSLSADVISGWSLAELAEPAGAGGLEAVHPRRLPLPDAAVVDVRPERVRR